MVLLVEVIMVKLPILQEILEPAPFINVQPNQLDSKYYY